MNPTVKERLLSLDGGLPTAFWEAWDFDLVEWFYEFLVSKNETGGFFSKQDSARILERHLFESMVFVYYVTSHLKVSRETRIADIGSGPGLPGFLFLCLIEPLAVNLIDSSRRRLSILEEALGNLSPIVQEGSGLMTSSIASLVKFRYGRVEELKPSFDLVVSRAFIPFPFSVEAMLPALRDKAFLALFQSKPPSATNEDFIKQLGCVSRETIPLPMLAFLGERNIVLLQKTAKSKTGFPRKWKQIKQDIEQLSSASQIKRAE